MNKFTLLLAILTLASCDLFKKGPHTPDLPQEEWNAPSGMTTAELDPDQITSGTLQLEFELNYSQGAAPQTVAVKFNQHQTQAEKSWDGKYRVEVPLGPYETTYRLTVGNRELGSIAAFSKWKLTEQLKVYDPAAKYREDPDLLNAMPDYIDYYQIDRSDLNEGEALIFFTLIYNDPLIISPPVAVSFDGKQETFYPDEEGDYLEYMTVSSTDGPFILTLGNAAYTNSAGVYKAPMMGWTFKIELEVNEDVEAESDFDWWDIWADADWGNFNSDFLLDDEEEEAEDEEEETETPSLSNLTYPAPDFYELLEWTENTGVSWMLGVILYELEIDFDNDCNAMSAIDEADFDAYMEFCEDDGYFDYQFVPYTMANDAAFAGYIRGLEAELEPYYIESDVIDDVPYKIYNFTYSGREYWAYVGKTETTLTDWAYYNIYFEWE